MKSTYTFLVVDTEEPGKLYGKLSLHSQGSQRTWSFSLSEDVSEDSWKAIGLFPSDLMTSDDSKYVEGLLYKRVPLKDRMASSTGTKKTEQLVKEISDGGLQVASDSFMLVPQ